MVVEVERRNKAKHDHYIVAIGASAGGLEAIHEFFDHMPKNESLSFIIIQHLSPDYKSLLVDLVSKHTHMKVFEAEHGMHIQKECIYVIPNNKIMTIRNRKLMLAEKKFDKAPNTAIDSFLHTLAEDQREKAIAIILSGTGTDGTKGIEAVKECGGLVIVQDPATAKFDGMPHSAITSGNADMILPPEMMPEEIYNVIQETPVHVLNEGKIDENLMNQIFRLVYKASEFDFHFYKTPTIIRRIERRMAQLNHKKLDSYVDYLTFHPEEAKLLSKDFLINVTKFFRDKPAFNIISQTVLPDIIHGKNHGDVLKVWVCACSTGEEAYSLAILINNYLEQTGKDLDVKIFATDIDIANIEFAARNCYPLDIEKDIEPWILQKYFVKEGKSYSIVPDIRKQIVFAKHNVIKDPPFIKNDLISCRNMLIYMNNVLQQKVLSTFHFSVKQGGYLFLGPSETASFIKSGLEEVDNKWKIYRKLSIDKADSQFFYRPVDTHEFPSNRSSAAVPFRAKETQTSALTSEFTQALLDDFGYVSFFIDQNYEIRESIGNFGRFLSLPEKKLNLNILKMVPPELSAALTPAIRKSWKENKKVTLKSIRVKQKSGAVFVTVVVKPVRTAEQSFTLIILGESQHEAETHSQLQNSPTDESHSNSYILELESELSETRHNLQLAIEGLETTNEELQSSNEELLSANEELQSSNEELQSLNEELHTLNTEHQLKIKELIDLNDDLNNYFRSTDIGQIFLDSELHIRKFNPAAVKLINLIETDIGRPISNISTNIRAQNLVEDVRSVLDTNRTIEKEVVLSNGNTSIMRIMPYVRQDKKTDGAVISFVDITAINELNNIVKGVFNASLSAIMAFKAVRDKNNRIVDFRWAAINDASENVVGKKPGEFVGKQISIEAPQLIENGLFEKYIQVVESDRPMQTEFLLTRPEKKWIEAVAVRMQDGFVATFTDITDKKTAEQKLKKNYNELISARENLKKLNSELETKIKERTEELSASEERFRLVAQATTDAIWDWDIVNNNVWWSHNFYNMFGYEDVPETLTRSFWLNKIHPDERQHVSNSIGHAINNNQKQWQVEYRFLKADGSYAYILDRAYLLHDEFNTPYRMLGSMFDLTTIKEAQIKEEKLENRFRFLANSMPQKVWTADPQGNIDYYNKIWIDYAGLPIESLLEDSWAKTVHPDDLKHAESIWIKSVKSGKDFEVEYRLRRHDGEYRWHLGRAVAETDEAGRITMWVGTNTDIHDQKTISEALKITGENFRQLADQTPFMIWKVDEKGNATYVNKPWIEYTGISFEDSLGAGWAKACHPEDSAVEYEKFMQAFKKHAVYKSKFRVRRKDGAYRWVLAQSNPIIDITFQGYIGSLTDITEQELAQQATKLLMQKKDEFFGIASHELKTPITSMKASLQFVQRLTQKEIDPRKINTIIEKANAQMNKLTSLVEDLLDVTKIQAGKMKLDKSNFVINDVLQDCLTQVHNESGTHKIELKGNLNQIVFADRHRLEQVIINFLSNAIKYSPGQDKVILSVEKENNSLKVVVTDFGIGIPEDKVPFLFDRFFRVQESSQKFSGLGLGLYISAEIIARHKGQVGVDSVEGEGSSFWFTIPISANNSLENRNTSAGSNELATNL